MYRQAKSTIISCRIFISTWKRDGCLVDLDGGEDKAFTQIKLPLQRPFYHLALIKIQTPANVAEEMRNAWGAGLDRIVSIPGRCFVFRARYAVVGLIIAPGFVSNRKSTAEFKLERPCQLGCTVKKKECLNIEFIYLIKYDITAKLEFQYMLFKLEFKGMYFFREFRKAYILLRQQLNEFSGTTYPFP